MVKMWEVLFTKNAEKDKKYLKNADLDVKTKALLNILVQNPFQTPPPYEKLIGDLSGYYSRRINYKYRLVYRIIEEEHRVIVHSMWSHYGE